MERYSGFVKLLLLVAIALVYLLFLAPWNRGMITVTGTSKLEAAPQVASFNASVTVSDDSEDAATSQVNTKMADLIAALKAFGIDGKDIKTQSISLYENERPEIMIYPPQPRTDEKQWRASNSIEIKLRDISKASALADLLNKSGATGISGPNFTIEDTKASDAELLKSAVEDAKANAMTMAKAGGRTLGRMMTVSEGYGGYPVPYAASALEKRDVSTPIEPGTETLNKSVTVTFEVW